MSGELLSLAKARRIALAAQGFDRPRPAGKADLRHLRRTLHQLGLLQIDFVNVLVPAHYLVPFSRLGPYAKEKLDELVYHRHEFTEQWAHEACILPVDTWPLLCHRMAEHRVRPRGFETFLARQTDYVDAVLERIRCEGPVTAAELPAPDGHARRIDRAWIGTRKRAVLEAHFGRGELAVAAREPNFARRFDLPERIIPPQYLAARPERDEAERALLLRAARAHGVGTAADLADYYRMPVKRSRARLDELVETGALTRLSVEGFKEPAYRHPEARCPKRIEAAALLSPFDPLVWYRPRGERLFDFEYRIEIYVPAPRRRWGYYVLPFLLGERIVARIDLRAERKKKRLFVPAAHLEEHADADEVAVALVRELQQLAGWLGLEEIGVGRRGGFSRALAAALRTLQ